MVRQRQYDVILMLCVRSECPIFDSYTRIVAYRLEDFSLRKAISAAFSLQRCSRDYLFETGNYFGLDKYAYHFTVILQLFSYEVLICVING